jgi:predicted nucleotidyltransferase
MQVRHHLRNFSNIHFGRFCWSITIDKIGFVLLRTLFFFTLKHSFSCFFLFDNTFFTIFATQYDYNKDMRRTEIVERIRQEARKLSPQAQTILYGSEARGDARPDSDIDLLVLVDKDKLTYSDKDCIIAPFYDIELDTGIIISMMIMPRKEWENRPFLNPFQNNVNKEGITL